MSLISDTSTFLEIAKNLESIENCIMENGGEINEETEKQLKIVESMLFKKTQGIVDFFAMSDNYFQSLDAKIKELQEKKRVETNKIENFKKHIIHVMKSKNIGKLSTEDGLTEIKLRKPLSMVVVTNEDEIPADFITTETKVVNKIDLKSIKAHLENGENVLGAKLTTGKESFTIKTKSVKG